MKINFVKMHSDGNDFVIVRSNTSNFKYKKDKIKMLSDRNKGIGFDQFIVIEKSNNADAFMRIYNKDGNQAEMCANAGRCVAALLFSNHNKSSVKIETVSNPLIAKLLKNENISLSIKIPNQSIDNFELSKKVNITEVNFSNIHKKLYEGHLVNMGNPHIVFIVPDLEDINLEKNGIKIETNSLFKKNINVEIVEIISKNKLRVKFWERGVGLTMSCGSGIFAAFYSSYYKQLCNQKAKILLPGGVVRVELNNDMLTIIGKAEATFLGEFNYE